MGIEQINSVVSPFGYYVTQHLKSPQGIFFELSDGRSGFDCFLKDINDESLSKLAEQIDILQ